MFQGSVGIFLEPSSSHCKSSDGYSCRILLRISRLFLRAKVLVVVESEENGWEWDLVVWIPDWDFSL